MVVQRTINNLKERPKDERKAVATWVSIGVIAILLLGWAIIFLTSIRPVQSPVIPTTATTTDTFDSHVQSQQGI